MMPAKTNKLYLFIPIVCGLGVFAFSWISPWWTGLIWAAVCGFLSTRLWSALVAGAVSLSLAWLSALFLIEIQSDFGVLGVHTELLKLPHPAATVVVMALVAGLAGVVSSLFGYSLRRWKLS